MIKIKATKEDYELYQVDKNGYVVLNKNGSKRKKRGGSRPNAGPKEIEIDWEVVEAMYKIGATDQEVADALGISNSTLRRREDFVTFKAKAKAQSKIKLRQNLYRASNDGDTKATIFLAKNVLGMSDKVENTNLNTDVNIQFISSDDLEE